MNETDAGAVIVRYIDELEAALRYVHSSMQPRIGRAIADLLHHAKNAQRWAGEIDSDLDGGNWLAPQEWRTSNDTNDRFDLYFEFDKTDCMDGMPTETWIAALCGFAESRARFVFGTNAIGQRDWKAILRTETQTIDELVASGFSCNPKTGELSALILIDREKLASAFAEDDFELALDPIKRALERIMSCRNTLNKLVAIIRKKS